MAHHLLCDSGSRFCAGITGTRVFAGDGRRVSSHLKQNVLIRQLHVYDRMLYWTRVCVVMEIVLNGKKRPIASKVLV